ncbi:hypothetical protein AVEN_88044-1 [Araneus ventricosus]|uniref:BTB domain-containing protein n=1 Tax=Araneus ventricosus TaxID=182803 RepID=A0A4Y2L541_ARAVE|nr:hypothetical protein AVEN_88044-1 [Araneus ventricosus]
MSWDQLDLISKMVSGSSSINVNLEIRIKDFRTASKSSTKGKYIQHSDRDFNAWFSALTSPNGFDKDSEGWLVVRPYVTAMQGSYRPQNSIVSWTVSVTDIEGNTRFPRSFTQNLSKDITDAKYLERSFILNRADEFLPEGVLTVNCYICFEWYNFAPSLAPENHSKIAKRITPDVPSGDREFVKNDADSKTFEYAVYFLMFEPLPKYEFIEVFEIYEFSNLYGMEAVQRKIAELFTRDVPSGYRELAKNDPETGDPIDDYVDFVMKNKILTQVVYLAESGKVFAIYDPPSSEGGHPKAWTFETRTESFNVILDDQRNSIGTRLLEASLVIRRCVNAPMKERREKRIKLPTVDSQTFEKVCYFVVNETLPKFEFDDLFEIYKFSHLYEMEALQRNCAEDIMNSLEHETDFKELQKLADFYSDEYLSELLYMRRHGDENLERDSPHFRMDDRPHSDCYV